MYKVSSKSMVMWEVSTGDLTKIEPCRYRSSNVVNWGFDSPHGHFFYHYKPINTYNL